MAQLRTFKCKKCGYSVLTEYGGHYALMSGEYYNFKCSGCKNIVSISADDLAAQRYEVKCPDCGKTDTLSAWNPVECHCPKCGSSMKEDESAGWIMAD